MSLKDTLIKIGNKREHLRDHIRPILQHVCRNKEAASPEEVDLLEQTADRAENILESFAQNIERVDPEDGTKVLGKSGWKVERSHGRGVQEKRRVHLTSESGFQIATISIAVDEHEEGGLKKTLTFRDFVNREKRESKVFDLNSYYGTELPSMSELSTMYDKSKREFEKRNPGMDWATTMMKQDEY
jgi:hypothetical protein